MLDGVTKKKEKLCKKQYEQLFSLSNKERNVQKERPFYLFSKDNRKNNCEKQLLFVHLTIYILQRKRKMNNMKKETGQ
jgi:hypothetical protein